MSITYEDVDFDEEKWEDLINSDEILTGYCSKSINRKENSNDLQHKIDIVKLSMNDLKTSTFLNTNKLVHLGGSMTILIPPSTHQRVRYENECKKIFRYISVPNNQTLTIGIPDLRGILSVNDILWMRITRTTVNHRETNLIFYHPYPLWIKNSSAKIHHGSVFIPITNEDMANGFRRIDTLAMIRLKQDALAKINTLAIYSSIQLDCCDRHSIGTKIPKRIRDEYQLQQSILSFQLVRVDQNNIAYPTDCVCQTDFLHELEAIGRQKPVKRKKIQPE